MKRIARVFPTKTSMSPNDPDAYFDAPDMFTPKYDEVHISVTFSWDIEKAKKLQYQWRNICNNVKIGGVAIDGESKEPFIMGKYLRKGITITSRGCPNKCSFCIVKNKLIEFDNFPKGNIIQDNNILACSDKHIDLVFNMLETQKQIEFKGGLETKRITKKIIKRIKKLSLKSIWVACDTDNAINSLLKAIDIMLSEGISKEKIFCYILIGKEELRIRKIWETGIKTFTQLYQPINSPKIEYTKEMKQYSRIMARPAITRNIFDFEKYKNNECGTLF